MRLHRKSLQPAVDRGLGDARRRSQGAVTPVGFAIGGLGMQGPVDHLGDIIVLLGAGPAGSEFVVQAFQSQFPVALAQLSDGHDRQAHAPGDRGVGFTNTAGKHDLGALDNRMRQLA